MSTTEHYFILEERGNSIFKISKKGQILSRCQKMQGSGDKFKSMGIIFNWKYIYIIDKKFHRIIFFHLDTVKFPEQVTDDQVLEERLNFFNEKCSVLNLDKKKISSVRSYTNRKGRVVLMIFTQKNFFEIFELREKNKKIIFGKIFSIADSTFGCVDREFSPRVVEFTGIEILKKNGILINTFISTNLFMKERNIGGIVVFFDFENFKFCFKKVPIFLSSLVGFVKMGILKQKDNEIIFFVLQKDILRFLSFSIFSEIVEEIFRLRLSRDNKFVFNDKVNFFILDGLVIILIDSNGDIIKINASKYIK